MKNFVTISFPDNPKMKDICIKGGVQITGDYLILEDAEQKEANKKTICLSEIKSHHISNVKFVSLNGNENIPELRDRAQTIVFSGFYSTNRGYLKCLITCKIYDRN